MSITHEPYNNIKVKVVSLKNKGIKFLPNEAAF